MFAAASVGEYIFVAIPFVDVPALGRNESFDLAAA
jgi:hypothetical protein